MRLTPLTSALMLLILSATLLAGAQSPKQLAKLTTKKGVSYDAMGQSVAVEDNAVFVGVPDRAVGGNIQQGVVSVYVRPANGWHDMTQVRTLKASDGAARATFGFSMAISGDTLAVGAPTMSGGCASVAGAVYVFVGSNGQMRQAAKLTPSDGFNCDVFGYSVAIGGNTIVVGSPYSSAYGTVYVYVKPAGGWTDMTETAKLSTSDGTKYNNSFGTSVSIDGNTVAAGSYLQSLTGEAYVYVKPVTGWTNMTETAKLTASDGAVGDSFGYSVSISRDTVLVGSPNNSVPGGQYYGAGYIYVRPVSGWTNATETAKLTVNRPLVYALSGTSVNLAGSTALLGAPGPFFPGLNYPGAVYIYVRPKSGWTTTSRFQAMFTSGDGFATDIFGSALSLSGRTIVVGAPDVHWDAGFNDPGPGAAYVFSR